jgi:large subunit ribosomal protein L32
MVIRMRHTRSHTGLRRSHHALKGTSVAKCENCGSSRLPHQVCLKCGKYKGRVAIDVAAKALKTQKKAKAKGTSAKGDSK